MEKIFINVDSYNNEGIKTIQGNNNAETYKIYLLKNKIRLSLVGKTVKLGYVMAGTTKGDIIEDLNITNAEQGEITFPITNKISKKDGVYTCQLAIYGANGFLEYTATFGLTVQANIFTKIAGEIADSKDFTYLENILDKASKLSEKLKENTSSATNINSNLESNITEANNINSKLLENTSTATGLNKNLESNIDLAKEIKETIKDLDTKNIEATSKIERLEGLNTKAEELSNNINKGLPLNSELVKNTEDAKAANTNLAATNQEATSKNTELQASLEKTKEFIDGLDGSQNIPQIRMDITELQNGLKSNQALSYEGSSISANNTLEGRTEGMKIGGRTLVNLWDIKTTNGFYMSDLNDGYFIENNKNFSCKPNTKYTIIYNEKTPTGCFASVLYKDINGVHISEGVNCYNGKIATFTTPSNCYYLYTRGFRNTAPHSVSGNGFNFIIVEGELKDKIKYFEGLKSFGEAEKVEDKYKITLLSHGKNLLNTNDFTDNKFLSYDDGSIQELREGRCITEKFYELPQNIVLSSSENLWKGFWIYDANLKFIRNVESQNDVLVTKQSNEKYYRIGIQKLRESILSKKVQLEEGAIKTEYEPYKCNKKNILIKEPLSEWDTMYEDNGQVKVFRGAKQYTITGNENWIKALDNEEEFKTIHFQINLDDSYDFILNKAEDVLSNNFPSVGSLWSKDVEGIYKYSNNNLTISILKTKLTTPTVEGLKAWLKANPTDIIYKLATPTTEVVENCVDIDLDTYQEKTYFNILNSIKGSLDFKVSSNIASIVQNTAREVNNIWDVINNLLVPSIVKANGNLAIIKLNNNLK